MSSVELLGEVVCTFKDHEFEVEKHVLHSIKIISDQETCEISGMCGLSNGELLLADKYNTKIKLLNRSYAVIATCDVPKSPEDVCSTKDEKQQ